MCDTSNYTPPPFGSPIWIAIPSLDVEASKAFYVAVFGWTFEPLPAGYEKSEIAMFGFKDVSAISGGITRVEKIARDAGGTPFNYYHVECIDATEKKIVDAGGKVVQAKKPEGDHGQCSTYEDPQGAMFGLYEMNR